MNKKKLLLTIKCKEKCPFRKFEGCCYECPDCNECEGKCPCHPADCGGRISEKEDA